MQKLSVKKIEMLSRTLLYTEEGTILDNEMYDSTRCGGKHIDDAPMSLHDFNHHNQDQQDYKACAYKIFDVYDSFLASLIPNASGELYVSDVFEAIISKYAGDILTVLKESGPNLGHPPRASTNDKDVLLEHIMKSYDTSHRFFLILSMFTQVKKVWCRSIFLLSKQRFKEVQRTFPLFCIYSLAFSIIKVLYESS